jgi:hypothetical protein
MRPLSSSAIGPDAEDHGDRHQDNRHDEYAQPAIKCIDWHVLTVVAAGDPAQCQAA